MKWDKQDLVQGTIYFFITKLPQIFQIMASAITTFSNIAFLSQWFKLYFTRSEYNPLKCTEKLSHVVSLFQQLHSGDF